MKYVVFDEEFKKIAVELSKVKNSVIPTVLLSTEFLSDLKKIAFLGSMMQG
ncbi:hypothetical protein [Sphingobacterium cellulitidis]|uniref:hypothetical protein n=1 Tax=Sphingobacterium cellulitidis TaxID=1768011 RepID=UPI0015C5AB2A|nr:hypothetical protein [Sphingobacterium cellulitidis]